MIYIIYHIFSKTIFAEREVGRENRIVIDDKEARCVGAAASQLFFMIYKNIFRSNSKCVQGRGYDPPRSLNPPLYGEGALYAPCGFLHFTQKISRHTYLKLLDFSQLFVAIAPMRKK